MANSQLGEALHSAAQHGDDEAMERLLLQGTPPDWTNTFGDTALFYATANGYPRCIALLAMHRADVNLPNDLGGTPLMEAASNKYNNRRPCLELLLALRANPDMRDTSGESALDKALRNQAGFSSRSSCIQPLQSLCSGDFDAVLAEFAEAAIAIHPDAAASIARGTPLVFARVTESACARIQAAVGRDELSAVACYAVWGHPLVVPLPCWKVCTTVLLLSSRICRVSEFAALTKHIRCQLLEAVRRMALAEVVSVHCGEWDVIDVLQTKWDHLAPAVQMTATEDAQEVQEDVEADAMQVGKRRKLTPSK